MSEIQSNATFSVEQSASAEKDAVIAIPLNKPKSESEPHYETQSEPKCKRFEGFLFTLLHVIGFASATLIAKLLVNYHPFTQATFRFQGLFLPSIFVLIGAYSSEHKKPVEERKPILAHLWPLNRHGNWKRVFFLLLRSIAATSLITLMLYSVRYIQVGDTLVILAAAPIFTSLLAHITLKEPCGMFQVCLAILSMVGVGIISRPPILTGAKEFDTDTLIGCSLSFSAMLLSSVTIVCLRYLRHVHFTVVSISIGTWAIVQNLTLALVLGVFEFPSGTRDILLTMAAALFTFIAQTSLVFAVKREEAGVIMLYKALYCVVGFILQKIFLNVPADIYSLLGATIVVISVVLTVIRKQLGDLPKGNILRRKLSFMLK